MLNVLAGHIITPMGGPASFKFLFAKSSHTYMIVRVRKTMSRTQILTAFIAIGSMLLLVGTLNITHAQWSNSTGNGTNSTSPGNATNTTYTVSTPQDDETGKIADAYGELDNP